MNIAIIVQLRKHKKDMVFLFTIGVIHTKAKVLFKTDGKKWTFYCLFVPFFSDIMVKKSRSSQQLLQRCDKLQKSSQRLLKVHLTVVAKKDTSPLT